MFEDVIKKLEEIAEKRRYVNATELMKEGEVKARITNMAFRNDKRGNEALFVTLELENGKLLVQKYTRTLIPILYQRIKEIGIEKLQRDFCKWQVEYHGRGFPRFYPVKE